VNRSRKPRGTHRPPTLGAIASAFALVALAPAPGCSGSVSDALDAAPSQCTSATPDLGACFSGAFFSACGGAGMPRLGCRSDGDCRWFSDGCVARGYAVSDCDADRLCCHGDWPFVDKGARPALAARLQGLGTFPWDRLRAMKLAVTVDASTSGTTTSFTCTGPAPIAGPSPCGGQAAGAAIATALSTLELGTSGGAAAWTPWVEIDFDQAGGAVGRVCAYGHGSAGSTCPNREPPCATSGTIRVNRAARGEGPVAGLVATIDATFPGGFTLKGSFVVP
jgi:hypothetical protein